MQRKNHKKLKINPRVIADYGQFLPVPDAPLTQPVGTGDSILLIRLSAIGDVVRGLPLISYLRHNGFTGEIGWAVHPPCDRLLENYPGIDYVHRIDRENWLTHPLRLYRQLRAVGERQYDWVFDLHGLLKSALVVKSARANHKIGFAAQNSKELNHRFQEFTVEPLPEKLPRILKYIQLLRPFTPEFSFTREIIRPESPDYNNLSEAVEQAGKAEPLLVHPATSHSRYGQEKEWGTANFRDLLAAVTDSFAGPILVTWGPGERNQAREVAEGCSEQVNVAPETSDLLELCYLIEQATAVVSGDTAPCHLTDMLNTPLVAIFGSSDQRVSGPLLTDYRLLTTRDGEEETADIPVRRVLSAVEDLLGNEE